jgi:transketolase
VEAGATSGWRAYTGLGGDVIGLDSFGESAPAGDLYEHFGITVDKIVEAVERVVAGGSEELPMAASN